MPSTPAADSWRIATAPALRRRNAGETTAMSKNNSLFQHQQTSRRVHPFMYRHVWRADSHLAGGFASRAVTPRPARSKSGIIPIGMRRERSYHGRSDPPGMRLACDGWGRMPAVSSRTEASESARGRVEGVPYVPTSSQAGFRAGPESAVCSGGADRPAASYRACTFFHWIADRDWRSGSDAYGIRARRVC